MGTQKLSWWEKVCTPALYEHDIIQNVSWSQVPVGTATVATRSFGSGELAILIGGGPGMSCDYMLPLGEMLAELGMHAVCFQHRGVPPSSWPDSGFSILRMADDVHAIREAYGGERVHIVAHSFGGYVAWAALGTPSGVASVTLFAPCSADRAANRVAEAGLGARLARVAGRRGGTLTERFQSELPAYLHDPELPVPAPLLRTTIHEQVHRSVLAAGTDYNQLATNARAYSGPATIFIGETDPLGLDLAHACVAGLERAETALVVLERAGHFPWLEASAPSVKAALGDAISRP